MWFCELHYNPKFPYFVEWENVFDVQGDPAIKLYLFTEFNRKDGHADLIYFRRTVEAQLTEEQRSEALIEQAMDRMMNPGKYLDAEISEDVNEGRAKRFDILMREEGEVDERLKQRTLEEEKRWSEEEKRRLNSSVKTIGNVHGHRFSVPCKVYENDYYGERLDNARTLEDVDEILHDYKINKGLKPKQITEVQPKQITETQSKPPKKHWWQ